MSTSRHMLLGIFFAVAIAILGYFTLFMADVSFFGEKTRMRTVLQEAQYDGEPCEGLGVETMQCEDEPCSNCTEPLVVVERCNCPRICLHVAQPDSCSDPVVCEGT